MRSGLISPLGAEVSPIGQHRYGPTLSTHGTIPPSPVRVLLVDDHPELLALTAIFLRRELATVSTTLETDPEAAPARIDRVLSDQRPVDGLDERLAALDGTEIHASLTGVPLPIDDEPPGQVVHVDITAIRRVERALHDEQ